MSCNSEKPPSPPPSAKTALISGCLAQESQRPLSSFSGIGIKHEHSVMGSAEHRVIHAYDIQTKVSHLTLC